MSEVEFEAKPFLVFLAWSPHSVVNPILFFPTNVCNAFDALPPLIF